jgi:Holliday junction resolvasome RuvABC endonuclease subunit
MKEVYTIIGIDIGTNTGISIYHISENKIVSVETPFINLSLAEGDNTDRLLFLEQHLVSLLIETQPIAVVIEAGFMGRFAQAFGLLSQFTAIITSSVRKILPFTIIYRVAPIELKSFMNIQSGKYEKDYMTTAVDKVKELKPFIDISILNEHQIDALALGYWCLERYRRDAGFFLIDDDYHRTRRK